jgi:hypothetical protein
VGAEDSARVLNRAEVVARSVVKEVRRTPSSKCRIVSGQHPGWWGALLIDPRTRGRSLRQARAALIVGAAWGLLTLGAAFTGPAGAVVTFNLAAGVMTWLVCYWLAYWRYEAGESPKRVWKAVCLGVALSVVGPLALIALTFRPVRRALPRRVRWRGGLTRRIKAWAGVGLAGGLLLTARARASGGVHGARLSALVLVFVWLAVAAWLGVASLQPDTTYRANAIKP